MGLFDGCLLACDLDGTLVSNTNIPKRNIDAIDFFTNEGGMFSVATGRSPAAVNEVLKYFNGIGPSVFTNGSVIFDYTKKEMLSQSFLVKESNFAIKKLLDTGISVGIQAHHAGKVYVPVFTEGIKTHLKYEAIEHIDCSVDEAVNLPLNKIMYLVEEQERVEEIKGYLKSLNYNCDFITSSATMYGKFYLLIEQCPKNIDKAFGLQFLINKFSIKKGKYFAIGDFYNDIPMIKAADIGAVTAEAPAEVKSVADFICGSAKNGAVADFIEYLSTLRRGS